jgi:hypothetical protein
VATVLPSRWLGRPHVDILQGRALSGDPLDHIREAPATY